MRLSNRVLWILILTWFILSFYLFYKYFFELKLTNLNIQSNVSGFSGSIINTKFEKDFFCETKKCVITEIPTFNYDLIIEKDNYKNYKEEFNLWKMSDLNIYLEKEILLEKLEDKNLENVQWYDVNWNIYNNILNSSKKYYYHNKGKLYIYNKNSSNTIEFNFTPEINYIKEVWISNLVIYTEVWSYNFDLNTKNLEYFSLFSDYIKINNNYIWIINSNDKLRKKNFWFENISWSLVIFYDTKTKKKYILEKSAVKISKIYLDSNWEDYNKSNKIYIENDNWETFIIKWY